MNCSGDHKFFARLYLTRDRTLNYWDSFLEKQGSIFKKEYEEK
jgi:hypothetical protein